MKQRAVINYVISGFILLVFTFGAINAASAGSGKIRGYATSYGDRGAQNTLIFIESMDGEFEAPKEHAVMNQINTEFVPGMLPVLKGTVVDFVNSDTGWHNVNSPEQSVTPFNLGTFPGGQKRSMRFDNIGVAPIACTMHPEMRAYVIVLGNPYFSVTDKMGKYEIKDVPEGEFSLRVWNKKWSSDIQKIKIENGQTTNVDFRLR